MGTGTFGWERASAQTRLGYGEFERLMRHGIDRGSAFIDTADLYGSHDFVGRVVKSAGRDRVTLLSKIWFQPAPGMTPTDRAKPEIERFLRELRVDMIDIVLIHCVTDPRWPADLARMRDELSELKQRGIVRAIGCSCHSHAALEVAAESDWADVILARINPRHSHMDHDAGVERVAATLRTARSNGKGVIGMKIYGLGDLTSPERRQESLRYVLDNNLVDAMTIGHLSGEQLDDTIANIDNVLRQPS